MCFLPNKYSCCIKIYLQTHVESLETFVGLGSEHQEEGESEATNGQQQPQHISAEVHVVHVEQEDDEDEESPHEVPIYHEGDDSSLDQEPHVVVTSSNSPPSHNQGNIHNQLFVLFFIFQNNNFKKSKNVEKCRTKITKSLLEIPTFFKMNVLSFLLLLTIVSLLFRC